MSTQIDKPTIAVWFSCGAASAVAAKKTIERYSKTHNIRIVNNPIAEEHSDNKRFLKDIEKWLGVEIEYAINPSFPSGSIVDVWEKKKAMSFPHGAPCTVALKKQARYHWERENECHAVVLGFTVDEKHRHNNFRKAEMIPILPVLIQANLSKQDCFQVLERAGINLPAIYSYGFPNANCVGCSKATSPTYWNKVREVFPEIFSQRAEQSRRLGVKLARVKNQRIYLDELDPAAKGRKLKSLETYQCSLFC